MKKILFILIVAFGLVHLPTWIYLKPAPKAVEEPEKKPRPLRVKLLHKWGYA